MLKRALALTATSLFAPLLFAASQPLQYTPDEIAAVQAVQSKMLKHVPHLLSVGDETQYRYVKALLRIHGVTPKKFPKLHADLETEHAKGSANAAPPRPAPGWNAFIQPSMASQSDNTIQPMNMIAFMANTGSNVTTSLLSSVPGGTSSTTMTVNYRMSTSTQPFYNSPVQAQYNAGTQFQQSFNAAPAQSGVVVATALFTTKACNSCIPDYTSVWEEDSTPNATSQCVTSPYYANYTVPPTSCPPVGSNCVNNGTITTNIIECYGRTGTTTNPCNYGWGGSQYPQNLLLQISGTMTFPSPIDSSLSGQYSLNMQVVNDGGCTIGYSSNTLPSSNFWIDANNSSQLDYCFPGAQLPSNACMQTASVAMYVILQVQVELDVSSGGNMGTGIVSSDPTQNPNQPYYALIPTVTVLQGCVAPGTKITLADGSEPAIETINGDGNTWAMIDRKGNKMPILGVSTGVERRPMVEITTSGGQKVLLSQMHPVATSKGMTPAVHVKAGDTLYTRKGATKAKSVKYVPYDGAVYNIAFNSIAKHDPKAFFANGILVGDLAAQQEMGVAKRAKPLTKAQMLKILPKEFHQDYLSSLETTKQ